MAAALRVVLSPLLDALFGRMDKPEFLNLFRKPKFDEGIVKKLRRKLLVLQGVLEDAENKHSKNRAVKDWLEELQEVIYQADDLLDLINTEALSIHLVERKYPRRSTGCQVSSSTNPSSTFSVEFLGEIMPKLEDIVRELEYFEKMIGILGLTKEVESKRQATRVPSTSLVDEGDVLGRDADKEEIIQILLSDALEREKLSVISIVGLGGIGKTALAQFTYSDGRVKFDTKAWVCVSEEYDTIRITKDLLTELEISFGSDESFNSLQVKLREGLSNKKFLLVLDDIWNDKYEDWLALSAPFNRGKEGSKIIVTTRNERVASTMGSQFTHRLNPMSGADCWSLFKQHALNNRVSNQNTEFESIGKKIVKKCGGLPLAIVTLAGLLRSKETIEEWDEILESEEWDQPNSKGGILPSLRLSYNHLPSQLKRSFAFCAVFHKNYKFMKDEVIRLWMANDMLKSWGSNKRPEDVGEEFLQELKVRSLFQQSSDGKYCMHDLVNDLAKSVFGKHIFRLDQDHLQQNGPSRVTRHFSYLISSTDFLVEKFEPINQLMFLRTFLPLDFQEGKSGAKELSLKFLVEVLPTFKSLRVLSLSGYGITELPNSFANLKQLRFLDLSRTLLVKLPSWICTFCNLQTLLLRHCSNLRKLPEKIGKLTNLRFLDISETYLTRMPMSIGRLENLHLLSDFRVRKSGGASIEELGKLGNLQKKLNLSGLENVADGNSASMAKMKEKKYIKHLRLQWELRDRGYARFAHDVLKELKPHSNVECIDIRGYCGIRFPNWLEDSTSFRHMVSLCFSSCESCYHLPAIGQLPSLRDLYISRLSKVRKMGPEIYGNCSVAKPFPSLKILKIRYMEELKEWHNPGGGVFSCLEELEIYRCPNLIGEIPKQLMSLRKYDVTDCPKLAVDNIMMQLPSLEEFCLGIAKSDGVSSVFNSQADFSSLRKVKISGKINIKLPSDLNKVFPCLEKLYIYNPKEVVSFPICGLPTTLKSLIIEGVENLELEIRETCHVSLEVLTMRYIRAVSVKVLPLGLFSTLRSLVLYKISNVEELSIPISLHSLEIAACDHLMSISVEGLPAPNLTEMKLAYLPKLKWLPERMHTLLPSLIQLKLESCPEIEYFPEGGLPSTLQSLYISDYRRFPSCKREQGFHTLPSLSTLESCDNREDETFPSEDFLLPSTLTYLILRRHYNLKMLDYGLLQHLTSLKSLTISSCPKFQVPLEKGMLAPSSQIIIGDCPELRSLPGLPASLSKLVIHKCQNLESLPEQGLPHSLSELVIHDCPSLQSLPEEGLPPNLSILYIVNCASLQSLSEQGLPHSLFELLIYGCPKLKSLPEQGLPPSLSKLVIENCHELQLLPEVGLPPSLSKLIIQRCPLLKQRLEPEKGVDWSKVAHIPNIIF